MQHFIMMRSFDQSVWAAVLGVSIPWRCCGCKGAVQICKGAGFRGHIRHTQIESRLFSRQNASPHGKTLCLQMQAQKVLL